MTRCLLLALLGFAALAGPAGAATVRVAFDQEGVASDPYSREDAFVRYSVLRFKAGPGERNRLLVQRARGGRIRFRDRGARVRPGRGCRAAGRHAVVCRRPRDLREVRVHLLGQADRLTVSRRLRTRVHALGGHGSDRMVAGGGRAIFLGELGDDRLVGGARDDLLGGAGGDDRVHGGGGRDHAEGGSGADRLSGGRGNDTLDAGGDAKPDTDRVSGGPGRDTASYAGRGRGVTISTDGGGGPGERDAFRSIENLHGGRGADVLVGDDGPNRLAVGLGGRDRVEARGGDDLVVMPWFGGSLDASCGDGNDRIDAPSPGSGLLARRDCEGVRPGSAAGLVIDPRPSPPAGRAFRMHLPCDMPPGPLVVRTATVPRPWFAAGPFGDEVARAAAPRGPAGTLCPVEFTLTDRGQELLAARGELPVEMPVGRAETISVLLTAA